MIERGERCGGGGWGGGKKKKLRRALSTASFPVYIKCIYNKEDKDETEHIFFV